MKTVLTACAGAWLVLGLCGCDHDSDRVPEPANVGVVVATPEYAVAYVQADPDPMLYDLAVTVQSNSGLPLAGALVQLAVDDGAGSEIQQANTDEWGRATFYFNAWPGTWVFIDACSTGFADSAVDLVTGGDPVVDVPLYLAPLVVSVSP